MEPIRIFIKDFYSINEIELDFSKFSSALILGNYETNLLKSNGSGKTSIYEAISWVLFNKTRQSKMDDLIRWSANEALVEIDFYNDNREFRIIRRRSRITNESSVSLFIKEGDKWINDSCSTNSETDKKISDLLKIDFKIFIHSIYFRQQDISLFANSTPSNRKDVIKSLINLERWDIYEKKAKEKLAFHKQEIEKYANIVENNLNIEKIQISNKQAIDKVNNEIVLLTQKNTDIQEKLHKLLSLKTEHNVNSLTKLQTNIVRQISDLKVNGKKLQGRQQELDILIEEKLQKSIYFAEHIENLNHNIAQIQLLIDSLNKENIAYEELEPSIFEKRLHKGKLEGILDSLQNTASKIGIGQCDFCFTIITKQSLPHVHNSRKQKQEETEKEIDVVSRKLIKIETEYERRKKSNSRLNKAILDYQNYKTKLDNLKKDKEINDNELQMLEQEKTLTYASMRSISEQIQSHKIELESVEKQIAEHTSCNVDIEIQNFENVINDITRQINKKNIELGALLKESDLIEEKIELIKTANDKLSFLYKQKSAAEQLVKYFGKEGIQAIFIENVVDELEQYANETLSYICNEPIMLKFRTQKKTATSWQETLDIDIIMNGFPQTFESLSEGEKFRVSLALRIGLSEVLVKRTGGDIKLLLLDEIDSPLDAYGLNNLENIIKGLEQRFKILVISHNNSIRERFSNIITVTKTSNGSFLA